MQERKLVLRKKSRTLAVTYLDLLLYVNKEPRSQLLISDSVT